MLWSFTARINYHLFANPQHSPSNFQMFLLINITFFTFGQNNFLNKIPLKFNSLEILKIPIRIAIIVQDLKLQFSFLLSRSDLHSKLKKVTVMIWRDFYDVSWYHPFESVQLVSTKPSFCTKYPIMEILLTNLIDLTKNKLVTRLILICWKVHSN